MFLNENIRLVIDWILNSGIQNIDGSHAGSFNAWYEPENKTYPFLYSEITGYGITTLLYTNTMDKNNIYVKRAGMAADWLIKYAIDTSGGVRARKYPNGVRNGYSFDSNILYTFDSGMVLCGLANIYSVTKDQRHLEAAIKVAEFMLSMQRRDGTFYISYDLNTGERINDTQEKWSTQSGSYQAKFSIGLLKMHNITDDESFRHASINVCNAALKMQEREGNFITHQDEKSTHTHPHCYSCEGLTYAGTILKENKFLESAAIAVKWALDNQLDNGGVPCEYINNNFITHERSDTLAQILRIGSFLIHINMLNGYADKMAHLKTRLLQFQSSNVQSGGFFYGTEMDGTSKNHINSWCSMFALQALAMYEQSKNNSDISLNLLI